MVAMKVHKNLYALYLEGGTVIISSAFFFIQPSSKVGEENYLAH